MDATGTPQLPPAYENQISRTVNVLRKMKWSLWTLNKNSAADQPGKHENHTLVANKYERNICETGRMEIHRASASKNKALTLEGCGIIQIFLKKISCDTKCWKCVNFVHMQLCCILKRNFYKAENGQQSRFK